MATHDIPRETWAAFFDDFSRTRQGALVTVEAVTPQTGPQVETRALPFAGISLEAKGSSAGTIQIMMGADPDDHVTHTITAATRVYHKTGAGVMSAEVDHDEALEITADSEPPVTYLRFRRPADSA
jgi:hypothetical protein